MNFCSSAEAIISTLLNIEIRNNMHAESADQKNYSDKVGQWRGDRGLRMPVLVEYIIIYWVDFGAVLNIFEVKKSTSKSFVRIGPPGILKNGCFISNLLLYFFIIKATPIFIIIKFWVTDTM